MVYKNFYFQLIGRIILISLNIFWVSIAIQDLNRVYTFIVAFSLVIIQIVAFVHYFNKTNRNLTNYFSSLLSKDFSQSLTRQPIKSLSDLNVITEGIKELIRSSVIEKENHYNYLKHVVSHIETGLISATSEGKILLMNNAVKKLFNILPSVEIFQINNLPKEITSILKQIKNDRQLSLSLNRNTEKVPVLVRKTTFILNEQEVFIVTFQNIKNAMEEKELESWQKLISILSHEIMNSMTPITTLTHAIKKSIEVEAENLKNSQIQNSTIEDILSNTNTIEKRSLGLIDFVNNYRNLTKVKSLQVENFNIGHLFRNVIDLFKPEFDKLNIRHEIKIESENHMVSADFKLLEQVLINLIKNALESFSNTENKQIQFKVFFENESNFIQISDNGCGISKEQIDQVFIPFYTTKTNGSGIGLSLSRQIMRLHGGEISIRSEENKGTIVTLRF
ncbi:MAG: HAMP domain-containing histidine kinase [Bacteroidetes bacterium]|nr:HAMP domain-containing histidine kinase [Bacteroidota bacterium]